MNKRFLGVAVSTALLLFLLLAQAVWAGQSFDLINTTGVEIHAVYIGPSESEEWGDNLLDEDEYIPHGATLEIEFAPDEDVEMWDVRVEDSEGNSLNFSAVELLGAKSLTLKDDHTAVVR